MVEIVLGILCLTWKGDKPYSTRWLHLCYSLLVNPSLPCLPILPQIKFVTGLNKEYFLRVCFTLFSLSPLGPGSHSSEACWGVLDVDNWDRAGGKGLSQSPCWFWKWLESPLLPRGMSARHGTLHPLSLGIWLPVLGRCCSPSLQKEKTGPYFWELLAKLFWDRKSVV